ncbi:ferrous iron transport protein B [Arcanobacterium wilhelmae]|uniref:Ferrous iron transport protein B n=1 Tax=Arcanobacterium wilhelmae TaxID=1803177 RepID=A0ABT9NB41_9ACTO|nr:ferrous iron transporter B [Arcanobacterium wilhelmae]MDP9800626.1 ferrous iron transport protein B [Arcanobacterium wilhelmae]WFN90033.1 ferrous iron transporter B [Arcanobacterium wilhelmae]
MRGISAVVRHTAPEAPVSQPTIALVGNPNVGKSTLFNAITGSHQKTVNAPGTTVEVQSGNWAALGARVLDLPGTYSLIPASPDEKVVSDHLAGAPGTLTDPQRFGGVDLVIAVLDGGSLTRSLYLLGQIGQTGLPVAVVITMADVARAAGRTLDPVALSATLGVPVMLADPRERAAATAVASFAQAALEARPRLCGLNADPLAPGFPLRSALPLAPDAGTTCTDSAGCARSSACSCSHSATAGLELGTDAATSGSNPADLARADALFAWVEQVEASLGEPMPEPADTASDKVDHVLLNPVVGPVLFLAIMWLAFKLAGEWIGPLQDAFDAAFSSTEPGAISLANGIGWLLGATGITATWLNSFLIGGLAVGLGVVASFVPLIAVIFVVISLLEDTGYMARVAFLGDRLMRKIGLDGRVILPLIMGFGCNVPSLSATRALPSSAQRLITVLITPYTSCAARLTIYLMVAKIFFPAHAGTVVFSMYVASMLAVVLGAAVLKRFLGRGYSASPLMLILPAYQVPRAWLLVKSVASRTWGFVRSAGKIIVVMTLGVWLLSSVPTSSQYSFADPEMPMSDSAYGRVAMALEPVFAPAGFGDWHMTGALMTGFVAKETVVSSIVTSYNMDPSAAGDAESNGDDLGALPELLTTTFTTTAGEGYQGLAAYAFLLFVLLYTPCLATVAEQVRLIGGKRTAIAVVVQLVVAWVIAVGVFQIGSAVIGAMQ